MNINLDRLTKLPSLDVTELELLPTCTCVYFAFNGEGELLYIGKALNLYQRWKRHHRIVNLEEQGFSKLHWLEVDQSEYSEIEADYINRFKTPLNIRKKNGKAFKIPSLRLGEEPGNYRARQNQSNVTVSQQVRADFEVLAAYMGSTPGTLMRQILETYWASLEFQALLKTAKQALKEHDIKT